MANTGSYTRQPWKALSFSPGRSDMVYATGDSVPSWDPATRQPLAYVPISTADDVECSISAARRFVDSEAWASSPRVRADALRACADVLRREKESVAELLTRDQGKTLAESRIEVDATADQFEFYSGLVRGIAGRTLQISEEVNSVTLSQPLGVVAIIAPWNWPLIQMAKALAPALAAGNSCVLKPAQLTSAVVMQVVGLFAENNALPSGALVCVNGAGSEIGRLLVENPAVDGVSFTGSVRIGRQLASIAAQFIKPIFLELGGKSPNLVFADANLEKAVEGVVSGSISTSGQMCTAGTRVIVQSDVADKFTDLLIQRMKEVVVGDGLNPEVSMGPLTSAKQRDAVKSYIDVGRQTGRVLFEGNLDSLPTAISSGFFTAPILFGELPPDSPLLSEEIFGPVITLQRGDDEDTLVAAANASSFGLAAGVWSSDISRVWRVGRKLQAGTVWVNTYNQFYPEAEAGSWKESGFGNAQGWAGIERFTHTKHLNFDARRTMWGS